MSGSASRRAWASCARRATCTSPPPFPLVNEKGDVIGINTFIRLDADSNRQTQTALGSDAIMGFLREKGIPFTEHQ